MIDIDEKFILQTLNKLTGFQYVYAISKGRTLEDKSTEDGVFYQLMPKNGDDGFFDWYCIQNEYAQFFTSKSECAIKFISNYLDWKENK